MYLLLYRNVRFHGYISIGYRERIYKGKVRSKVRGKARSKARGKVRSKARDKVSNTDSSIRLDKRG